MTATQTRWIEKDRGTDAEFAWRAHDAIEAWTARADLKASIMLALQGGALVFIITGRDTLLASPSPWPAAGGLAAVAVLIAATCLTALAVMPALGQRHQLRREFPSHLIYFGHLRMWQPATLAIRLSHITDEEQVAMLARQLVFLSRLTWRKHRLLQLAVLLTIVVIVALTAATVGAQISSEPGWLR